MSVTKPNTFAPIPSHTEDISKEIIESALKVHTTLGPGLLESVYETCLAFELTSRKVRVETQISLPLKYEGITVEAGLRMDMLVDNCVIVEIKAVEKIEPIHEAQFLSYLRMSGCRVGLLIISM